jgi:hypothetical protein
LASRWFVQWQASRRFEEDAALAPCG